MEYIGRACAPLPPETLEEGSDSLVSVVTCETEMHKSLALAHVEWTAPEENHAVSFYIEGISKNNTFEGFPSP